MSLRLKFILSFVGIASLVLVVGVINLIASQTTVDAFDEMIQSDTPAIAAIGQIEASANEVRGSAIHFVLMREIGAEAEEEIEDFEAASLALAASLAQFSSVTEAEESAEELVEAVEAVHETGETLIDAANSGADLDVILEQLEEVEAAEDTLEELLNEVRAEQDEELIEEATNATDLATQVARFDVVSVIIVMGSALAAGFLLARSVVNPISELQTLARRFVSGDYSKRVAVNTKDEVGQLAQAFNQMADSVQSRDTRLNELNQALEERIVEAQTARERAERSDQVKSAFLASMSHELRTPLNSVINFTKFVMKGVMGPVTEKQEETLSKVVGSAKHLLNLINDVLDISKIESGSLNLFVEENVDVEEILNTVKSTAESLLSDKPIQLQLDIESDLPHILGDRQRVLQIMLNMVSNACKFTDQGHIKLSAHRRDGLLEIGIQDTGPGIAPEDHEAVFEPFKQTQTGLREGTGTGLGMPISKSLAEAHGGRMWVESVLGQGATFYLTLPIRSEKLKPVLATQPIALN
jgi:signal transduction histidine kinase